MPAHLFDEVVLFRNLDKPDFLRDPFHSRPLPRPRHIGLLLLNPVIDLPADSEPVVVAPGSGKDKATAQHAFRQMRLRASYVSHISGN